MFSVRLKLERERAGLTQDNIAEVCKNPDGEMVTRSTVSQWEKQNGPKPRFHNLIAVAKRLEISLDYLIGFSNRREINHRATTLNAAEETAAYDKLSENAIRMAGKWQALPPEARSAIEVLLNSMSSSNSKRRKGG